MSEPTTAQRILSAPVRFVRAAGEFVNPKLKAGRIPYGRIAIVTQIIVAVAFVGYTMTKKGLSLPFASDPYKVQIVFANAEGLDQYDQPAAGVAGAFAGRVTDVRYQNGNAIATLTLDSSVRGKIFADASATLRPASTIQNLLIDVDPGSPKAGGLPDGVPIPQEQTQGYVSVDQLTSVLDSDTQAYVQIIVNELQRALTGQEGNLRHELGKLGEISDTATPISRALAERRHLLSDLVSNLDVIFKTLSIRGDELGEAIDAGARTLQVTADRSPELEQVTRKLAPLLATATQSLAASQRLSETLLPALDQLVPAAQPLAADATKIRELVPLAESVFGSVNDLEQQAARPLSLLYEATKGLKPRMQELIPVMDDFAYRTRLLDKYKEGAAQFADTWSGAFSASDNGGIYGQVELLKIESPLPENFGLPASAAQAVDGGASKLDSQLATALENQCRLVGPLACLMRFTIPGLPGKPLTADDDGNGGGA